MISCVRCRIESPSGTIAQRVPCQGMLQPIKGIHRPTKLERIDPIFGRSNSRTCVEGKLIFDCFKLEISGHARLFASVVFCYFESFMSCTISESSPALFLSRRLLPGFVVVGYGYVETKRVSRDIVVRLLCVGEWKLTLKADPAGE